MEKKDCNRLSDGDDTDDCDEVFVGFTECHANTIVRVCTIEQTRPSTSTSKKCDGGTSKGSLIVLNMISKLDANEIAAKSKQFRIGDEII